jgi:hypothetical protein
MTPLKLCIGHPVWLYDENHRVYTDRGPSGTHGQLIWREHWQKYEIIAETRVSWSVGTIHDNGRIFEKVKLPKKNPREKEWYVAFSKEEIDERVWIYENAYDLGEFIGRKLKDYKLLREIATLVGYESKKP